MSNTAGQYDTQNSDPERRGPIRKKEEENSWILDQLNLGGIRHMVRGAAACC